MTNTIKACDREHLISLIQEHLEVHGNECDLNHIDVSGITDMSSVFEKSRFNLRLYELSKMRAMKCGYFFLLRMVLYRELKIVDYGKYLGLILLMMHEFRCLPMTEV